MIIKTSDTTEINEIFTKLDKYVKDNYKNPIVKFLDLGTHKIRLLIYSKDFVGHIEKQMTYVMRDNLNSYDATLVLWNEKSIKSLPQKISNKFDLKNNLKLRIETLVRKREPRFAKVFDERESKIFPIIWANFDKKTLEAIDKENNTYYYGVEDLSPEEFIKEGHLFVQFVNKIVKSKTTNIVHGAVIGSNNNGVLFCARGQRGKSTLTVLSMMESFEYVSDDYLTLEKENENLYSYPIYSIITLSPKMYNELYDRLDGTRFVSNNARKDKYVINIKNFHNQFKTKYPIKICIFPEIVNQEKPSINLCTDEEKGRAITQLIQSTVSQMRDSNNTETIQKLYSMVKDFNFYKLNLCPNIHLNTEFLREFLSNLNIEKAKSINEDNMFVDITFDIANILNPKTGTLYQMNHFATAIYESLLNGITRDEILKQIKNIDGVSSDIEKDLDLLINEIKQKGLLRNFENQIIEPNYDLEQIQKNNYKLSFKEFGQDGNIELLKKGE